MASDFDQLPDYNSLEAAEYRSLSPGAIIGLVLGLLSPLALITPLLVPLPVVAAILSWSAARSIRKSPETRAGLGLALTGLGLAVAVVGTIYARGLVVTHLHQTAAERVAEQFLERLRGEDSVGAYELTLVHHKRLPTTEAAEIYYKANDDAAQLFTEFKENPVIRSLANGTEPELIERVEVQQLRYGKLATGAVYKTTGDGAVDGAVDGAADGKPRKVTLVLERTSPRASRAVSWRVAKFEFADLAGSGD